MKFEPYNFSSFEDLVQHAYMLGWYSGKKTLFNLRCEGAFEGFSGRASEDWEQRFILTSDEITTNDGRKYPSLYIIGETVKEVCDEAIEQLKQPN